jgi:hypothetical protein
MYIAHTYMHIDMINMIYGYDNYDILSFFIHLILFVLRFQVGCLSCRVQLPLRF